MNSVPPRIEKDQILNTRAHLNDISLSIVITNERWWIQAEIPWTSHYAWVYAPCNEH